MATATPENWKSVVDEIVGTVVAEHAPIVDAEARFPEESMRAFAEAGLYGLLTSTEVGGLGKRLREASYTIDAIAQQCGSTAMVMCMHYCGAAVLEAYGTEAVRRAVVAGEHLSTLAFSEAGSRSHFWAPLSTAKTDGDSFVIEAKKSWITSSRAAMAYVWSSTATDDAEGITIWTVPSDAPGLSVPRPFDGLGLRGNDSTPVLAEGVRLSAEHRLGAEGAGFDVMMGTVLPTFSVLNASCSLGLRAFASGLPSATSTSISFCTRTTSGR